MEDENFEFIIIDSRIYELCLRLKKFNMIEFIVPILNMITSKIFKMLF